MLQAVSATIAGIALVVSVIVALVRGLPPSLAPLAALQPLEISDLRWAYDVERLTAALTGLSAES